MTAAFRSMVSDADQGQDQRLKRELPHLYPVFFTENNFALSEGLGNISYTRSLSMLYGKWQGLRI